MSGPDATLAAIERALVRIRRSQGRRTIGRLAVARLDHRVDLGQLDAVFAVDEGPGVDGGDVTVGRIADRLGIDPSRASRLVAAAIRAGHLARVASQADGRRVGIALTDSGRAIAEAAHGSRRAFYDRLMRDWSDRDRQDFARLLTRFTDALAGIRDAER